MEQKSNVLQNDFGVLASDLDGTLIPLPGMEQHEKDLIELEKLREAHGFTLIFATGRSFVSVLDAIEQYALPIPDWIICNVGTSIYEKSNSSFSGLSAYDEKLGEICSAVDRSQIEAALGHLDKLRLQSDENQSDFKLSYWCEEGELHGLIDQVNKIQRQKSLPYTCLGSVDPFNRRGLIDILPRGVNKAYALDWLSDLLEINPGSIVYAGDSGNDLAALVGGYASILVGNASEHVRSKVSEMLQKQESPSSCYFARNDATSGVLEGIRHYRLVH